MRELLRRLIAEEEGQGVVEYTLMIGLVVMGLYTAINIAGVPTGLATLWGDVSTEITNASAPAGG